MEKKRTGHKFIVAGEIAAIFGILVTTSESLMFLINIDYHLVSLIVSFGSNLLLLAYIFVLTGSGMLGRIDATFRQCVVSARVSMILWLLGKLIRIVISMFLYGNSSGKLLYGLTEVLMVAALLILCVFVIYSVIADSQTRYLKGIRAVIVLIIAGAVLEIFYENYSGYILVKYVAAWSRGLCLSAAFLIHILLLIIKMKWLDSSSEHKVNQQHVDSGAGDDGEKEILLQDMNQGSNDDAD